MVKDIVIWAHSECRSTMSLYREVERQAGVPVTTAVWKYGERDDVKPLREKTGQRVGEYSDLNIVPIGDDLERGRALLSKHKEEGAVHVFCVYQVSQVWRQLIKMAKKSGARVVVYAEAPCEMCVGVKAWLKRLYYRFLLPCRVGWVSKYVDLFLCESGEIGIDRLLRIGWRNEKIVPFGYASPTLVKGVAKTIGTQDVVRVLHTGVEAEYRDVETLLTAVKLLNNMGVSVEVARTHGNTPLSELEHLYKWADVFVACGLCEPWGMRVNDAIHAGLPVIVSSGMGAKMIVERCRCGSVYKAGDAMALAEELRRFAKDRAFAERCRDGVATAHEAWLPEAKAKEFIKLISG